MNYWELYGKRAMIFLGVFMILFGIFLFGEHFDENKMLLLSPFQKVITILMGLFLFLAAVESAGKK
ncbi:MAG: hypothetical protein PHT54_01305 [Candidatus Nanoarchaeia archaeon]|nr:hypothetical protein [Candidatus Nanoarchaeia archaeon]